jgi:hypothetical protein
LFARGGYRRTRKSAMAFYRYLRRRSAGLGKKGGAQMWKALAVATAALSLTTGAAFALTVVNEDAKEYTLRVDLGEKETTHKIPANETVKLQMQKDVCPATCGLNGPWYYSWMAEAGATVTIKNGEPLAVSTGAATGASGKAETPRATESAPKKTK